MDWQEYKEITFYEKQQYIDLVGGKKQFLLRIIKAHPDYYAWKYVHQLRRAGYYYELRKKSVFYAIKYLIECRKKNKLGRKLGIEMGECCAKRGLMIFHTHGIVINGNVRMGQNVKLHGNNCIGNSGLDSKAPVIGNNVDIGVGAKIIGDVEIADDIVIGAGAVVVHSFLNKGVTLVGIPAREIKKG